MTILVAQMALAGEARRQFAAGEKEAVLMLPPEFVCDNSANKFLWTADGSNLVATRNIVDIGASDVALQMMARRPSEAEIARMNPRTEVVLWSLRSRKSRTVFSLPIRAGNVEEIEAMPASDRIILHTSERIAGVNGGPDRNINAITMLLPSTGNLVRVNVKDAGEEGFVTCQLSETRPLGALQYFTNAKNPSTVRFFGPSGKPGASFTLPLRAAVVFDNQGLPGYVIGTRVDGKVRREFRSINPSTGAFGAPTVPPEPKEKITPSTVRTVQKSLEIDGAKAPTILLTLSGGKPLESGIVSTDGDRPLLSPGLDAIAYVSQGSLFVRPLAKVPRQVFDEAMVQQQRAAALSSAKQVGIAFIIYASDMDDVLPDQGADVRALVGPYLKNDRLFDGFTYTFGGGKMVEIENPATTELGYVTGPGGRAVVYTDGHAVWVPDKP